jgi:hypothetical protein
VGEKTVEGELVKMDQPGEHKSSPNWDEIEIEGETEGGNTEKLDNLGGDYDKTKESANADQAMKEILTEDDQASKSNMEEAKKQTRQSQRIKDQGLEGIKIADKASLVAQKKNLEGNHIKLKNSFAVLSNNELVVRAGKMGVETSRIDMEKIELIKDLETARANLENRMENIHESSEKENMMPLPLKRI